MTNQQIVYVVQEWPAVTQTFVEREVSELRKIGHSVKVYALSITGNGAASSDSELLDSSRRRLVSALAFLPMAMLRTGQRRRIIGALLRDPAGQDVLRQVFALLHAVNLSRRLSALPSSEFHFHAHFFGRAADVAHYTTMLSPKSYGFTVTGHAGDVISPHSAARLRLLIEAVDCVVCASEAVQRGALAVSPVVRTEVVHCGVPSSYFSMDHDRDANDGPRLLTVGRLVPKKGVDLCIRAARELQGLYPSLEWRVVGEGPEREALDQLMRDEDVQRVVRLLGHQSPSQIETQLGSWADVFVLPVRVASNGDTDGIPVAIMEAMAKGVPVVTTPVAGIPELVEDGVSGKFVDLDDAQSLAKAISDVLDDEGLRSALGRNGHTKVLIDFNSTTEARKMIDVFEASWRERNA